MDINLIESILAQNVAALTMAVLFIWYLNKRDTLLQDTFEDLGKRLDRLAKVISKLEGRIQSVESSRDREERRRRTKA